MSKKNIVLLKMVQKGNATVPTIYQFDEHNNLEVTTLGFHNVVNRKSGKLVKTITDYNLREMGYSPVKLVNGNTLDQSTIDTTYNPFWDNLKYFLRYMLFGVLLLIAINVVGSLTGCTDYFFQQLDKDLATTQYYPVENMKLQIELNKSK